jgi:protein TonB
MRKVYAGPEVTTDFPSALLGSLLLTVLIFMMLHFVPTFTKDRVIIRDPPPWLRPVPPQPPKQPPPEQKKPEEKPKLKEKLQPLTLSQLEIALNPGVGGALEGDFGLRFGAVAPNTIEEMIFALSDVDKEPVAIYQPQPNYPINLYRAKIGGTVSILFVVNQDGTVSSARVQQTSGRRELDDAALAAVMKYKFTPGIKDGQPVKTWFTVPITFSPAT